MSIVSETFKQTKKHPLREGYSKGRVLVKGDLRNARPPQFAEHNAVLRWVRLSGDGVASEGVRLGHLAGPGADHRADWCCGRHFNVLVTLRLLVRLCEECW